MECRAPTDVGRKFIVVAKMMRETLENLSTLSGWDLGHNRRDMILENERKEKMYAS